MYPVYGVPQLHHDQLNIIAKHLQQLGSDISRERFNNDNHDPTPVINKLTRRKLKLQDDWRDWQSVEFEQLDMYENQTTFGPPCQLPQGANVLNLLWTYTFKEHEH